MPRKQKYPHLLGSKWTARQKTEGWRHFQVANRRQEGPWVFAELVASCDPTVRLWINAKQLTNRLLWQPGWQPLNQMAPEGEPEREPEEFFWLN
ncbi:MAG: TIGR02450 family Trp-rich protein [Leptolyngbya sp. DLM2.Bin27]|nr:MAG: TIGR02450 family Trp-rich protein [Leptolyngbya sp. DLM2.Bin27]